MIVTTIIWATCGLFTAPLPYRMRYRLITSWTHFNLWCLKYVCGLDYEVHGRENIPTGPAVVMSKHQSAWETMALQKFFSPQVWVLKRELLYLPFFGWSLALLRPIAINRSAGTEAIRQLVEQGTERLQSGAWVVVFPEGTRIAPGQRGKYRAGGALLAEKAGYPVIPVAHNAGEFWGRKQWIKWPGTIQVRIGRPIDPKGSSAAKIRDQVEEWIENQMLEISGKR